MVSEMITILRVPYLWEIFVSRSDRKRIVRKVIQVDNEICRNYRWTIPIEINDSRLLADFEEPASRCTFIAYFPIAD